jgi:GDSL-like Lipase/Acylhydrolase family
LSGDVDYGVPPIQACHNKLGVFLKNRLISKVIAKMNSSKNSPHQHSNTRRRLLKSGAGLSLSSLSVAGLSACGGGTDPVAPTASLAASTAPLPTAAPPAPVAVASNPVTATPPPAPSPVTSTSPPPSPAPATAPPALAPPTVPPAPAPPAIQSGIPTAKLVNYTGPLGAIAEKQITTYPIKLAAQRQAVVNLWASATGVSDYIASCVDDAVVQLQATNRWADFDTIHLCASDSLANFMIPLKGNALTNNGFVAADCSLLEGFGDLNNLTKSLTLQRADLSAADVAVFATTPVEGTIFDQYGLDVATSRELGANSYRGNYQCPVYAPNQLVFSQCLVSSGWRRFATSGSTLTTYNDLQVGGNQFATGTGQTFPANSTMTLFNSSNPNTPSAQRAGRFKVRLIAYRASPDYFPDETRRLNNQQWAIVIRQLNAKLLAKEPGAKVWIGDSITAGANSFNRTAFVARCDSVISIANINAGRGGNGFVERPLSAQPGLLKDYLTNVSPWVKAGIAKQVIIAMGINDLLQRGQTVYGDGSDAALVKACRAQLEATVAAILADGLYIKDIQLFGHLWGNSGAPGANRNVIDLDLETYASNNGMRYIKNWEIMNKAPTTTKTTWYGPADNIHPLDTGMLFAADTALGVNL